MPGLPQGLDIVVQSGNTQTGFRCQGFTGIALQHPCQIVLTDLGFGGEAGQQLQRLEADLTAALTGLQPGVQTQPAPCACCPLSDPRQCQARAVPECIKVLVIVGDGTRAIPARDVEPEGVWWYAWLHNAVKVHILPVFPQETDIQACLPAGLKERNASVWRREVKEAIHDILYVAGIDRDRRLFISYIRAEASALAEQLFEALTKQSFEVFLDRFSVPPGVDFQEQLTEDLADKSLVLVLESPRINTSEWTQYEIGFAKKHKLGFVALTLPPPNDTAQVLGIDASHRLKLEAVEVDASQRLTEARLPEVLERIRQEHRNAALRRQYELQLQLHSELQRRQIESEMTASGLYLAKAAGGDYGLWLTARPPRLMDFYQAQMAPAGRTLLDRALLAPRQALRGEHAEMHQWLERLTRLGFYDPSGLRDLVDNIANGRRL